ncbi:hypothetical protein BKH43_06310 [Helicobacter sp. 13S00401-1]|uniref:HemK/PrmC family methyltransferase n=1 Tax=Helicobacter sp. 13S00401-1 TaxID=1905758 RepID=UPI000BA5E5BF|nr:HemK/PrmC family methyltransferase [Helicobacter sp. 13S00401-1]PAF49700.1 hypothetical protein BKH43_06310 [Helicobacter sp. 13S00401-1]
MLESLSITYALDLGVALLKHDDLSRFNLEQKDFLDLKNLSTSSQSFKIPSPRSEAESLLAFVLDTSRILLHTNYELVLSKKDLQSFFDLVCKRASGYPLEYIFKKASFYGREFFIDERVLIPRSDTEALCENALKLPFLDFVEVGVGSGIISITLSLESKNAGLGLDISKDALDVARINAKVLNATNLTFIKSNLLDSLNPKKDYTNSLLISNPPYIAKNYPLDIEVLHEPHIALFGGEKGDELVVKLIRQASAFRFGYLAFEIGYDQEDIATKILKECGYKEFSFFTYAGLVRGFIAKA